MKNGKYCILIADDEKEIRDILRLLLEGEGYAVLTACNRISVYIIWNIRCSSI